MSKLKEVLGKRIATIDARLAEIGDVEAIANEELRQRQGEIDAVATGRVPCGKTEADLDAIREKLGLKTVNPDYRKKRLEVSAEVTAKYEEKIAEAQRLTAEREKLQGALPFISIIEDALADYLPLVKEVSAELEPQLVDVIMVLVEFFTKAGIEVWGRTQHQFAADVAMLWAEGLKIKRKALIAAGFKPGEAMQLLLATAASPMNAALSYMKSVGAFNQSLKKK